MNYDSWKTAAPPEYGEEDCIRDDSTECNCSRCHADENRFWREQDDVAVSNECECPRDRFDTTALDDAIGYPCESCGGIVQ